MFIFIFFTLRALALRLLLLLLLRHFLVELIVQIIQQLPDIVRAVRIHASIHHLTKCARRVR